MLLQNKSLQCDRNKVSADKLQYTKSACRQDDLDDFFQRMLYKLDEYICNKKSSVNHNQSSTEPGSKLLPEGLKADLSSSNQRVALLQPKRLRSNCMSDPTLEVSCAKVSVMLLVIY